MKNASISVLFIVVLVFSGLLYAQDQQPHVYVITTFESLSPDGGSIAERDSLTNIWVENVVDKNEFILNQTVMRHMWGSNSSDYVVINEYKNFADIENAQSRNTELIREFMPDDMERAEYFNVWGSYFGNHSDEIYQGLLGN